MNQNKLNEYRWLRKSLKVSDKLNTVGIADYTLRRICRRNEVPTEYYNRYVKRFNDLDREQLKEIDEQNAERVVIENSNKLKGKYER